MIRRTEIGLVPAAYAGYVTAAGWIANLSLTGYSLYALFGDEDPGEELASQTSSGNLEACKADHDQGTGLTDGSRAYYLSELETWRAAAASLSSVNRATFLATLDRIQALLQQDTQEDGTPIGLCHVYASLQILNKLFFKLQGADQSSGETHVVDIDEQTPPAAPPARTIVIALLVVGGLYFGWRMTK